MHVRYFGIELSIVRVKINLRRIAQHQFLSPRELSLRISHSINQPLWTELRSLSFNQSASSVMSLKVYNSINLPIWTELKNLSCNQSIFVV